MVAIAAFGCIASTLSSQIGALSIGDVAGAMGMPANSASWLPTLYLSVQAVSVPLVPISVIAFGPRAVLLTAALAMIFGSLAELAGQDILLVVVARVIQGAAAGVFPIMTMLLVMRSFPPGKGQREGLLVFAASTSIALGVAASAAGWMLTEFSWQAPVAFQLIWAGLAFLAVWSLFPAQPANIAVLRNADWRGYLLLSFGTALLVAGLLQGERLFWFESRVITSLVVSGSVLLSAGAVWLLTSETPFVQIRLLAIPTFGWSIFMAVALRFALLVVAFVVPQYLFRLQGYRPENLADITIWILPFHLVGFPLAYFMARMLDPRLVLFLGLSFFASAAFVNIELDPLWAAEQFRLSMAFLGIGQAFFVYSLLVFATNGLGPAEGPTAGTLFNLTRIVGQALGVALLSTFVTEREKFHSNQIIDHITAFSGNVEARLSLLTQQFASANPDPVANGLRASSTLSRQVADQAYVLGYSDAFFVLTAFLAVSAFLVWMLPDIRVRKAEPLPRSETVSPR
ncbi:MFS transporter [Leisingera sp. D0M16]|uniref:MFS transporter n=1 Tax=Leisingera coralii TaxID=3351347 RepID=UPI003B7D4B4C